MTRARTLLYRAYYNILALITRLRWRGRDQRDEWLDLDRYGKWRGNGG